MTIGGTFGGTTSASHATGYTGLWWWDPTRSWSATVHYSGLTAGPTPGGGASPYYNPNSGSDGYDGIYGVTSPSYGQWWNWYGSTYDSNYHYNYYVNHPTYIVGGTTNVSYNSAVITPIYTGTVITDYKITFPDGSATTAGGTSQSAIDTAKNNLFRTIVDTQYGNWGNWYKAWH